VPGMSNN